MPAIAAPVRHVPWDVALARVAAWATEHGHALIPQHERTPDGWRIGKWVHNQRSAYRTLQRGGRSPLTEVQVQRLANVPGWTWDARKNPWWPEPKFSAALVEESALVALQHWLATCPPDAPFTEADVRAHPEFQRRWGRDQVQVTLAALVAAGTVTAKDAAGQVLTWEQVIDAEAFDETQTFTGGGPALSLWPAAPLLRYIDKHGVRQTA